MRRMRYSAGKRIRAVGCGRTPKGGKSHGRNCRNLLDYCFNDCYSNIRLRDSQEQEKVGRPRQGYGLLILSLH